MSSEEVEADEMAESGMKLYREAEFPLIGLEGETRIANVASHSDSWHHIQIRGKLPFCFRAFWTSRATNSPRLGFPNL